MPGKHDVYIFDSGCEYRVRPAVSMIDGRSKKFKIRNLTDHAAILAFPSGFLINNQDFVVVTAKSHVQAKLVDGLDGHYHYAVVINKNGTLLQAQGESAPSVIVDP